MTNAIRIDHLEKEILISKSFAKAAMNSKSQEYKELAKTMKNHPDYKVSQRNIKKNPNKETYIGLTYEYMKDYIILTSSPEEKTAALAEFEHLLLLSRCQNKSRRYPIIKQWFLNKYPEVKEFGVAIVAAAANMRAETELYAELYDAA